MKLEDKIKFSNELTDIYHKFKKLGASREDLKKFDSLIMEITHYKESEIKLGELF